MIMICGVIGGALRRLDGKGPGDFINVGGGAIDDDLLAGAWTLGRREINAFLDIDWKSAGLEKQGRA